MNKETKQSEPVNMEIMTGDALNQITRAEIDTQISTAHRFPRSMEKFKQRSFEMATMDEETAASCIYSRPVGKDKDGRQKYAQGLSVRTAEIVGACYGNLRVGAMLTEQTERQVKARGYAHDLESNFAATSEVIESTVKKDGTPYDERMRIVIAKAVLAKARRDATFMVVPKALCKSIETAARKVAVGDSKTFETRRKSLMEWITSLKIDSKRVFAAIGVNGINDIGVDQLALITGLRTAMNDGDISIDEAFPLNYMPVESKPEQKPNGEESFRDATSYQKLRAGFTEGRWGQVEVHWGTDKFPVKGKTLVELEKTNPSAFHFLRIDWQPKLFRGKMNLEDLALRAALDAAHEDYERTKSTIQNHPEE